MVYFGIIESSKLSHLSLLKQSFVKHHTISYNGLNFVLLVLLYFACCVTLISDHTCYEKFVTWTMIGFFPTFVILRILIWSVALISNVKGKVIKIVLPICTCIRPKKRISAIVCRRITIILISSYFFMMPFIIGVLEKTTCKAPALFSLAGLVCGLLINIVWSEDENNDGLQNRNRTNSIYENEEEEL